jgi:hypothetical protein
MALKLSEATRRGLRMDRPQSVIVPPRDPKPGATRAKCPYVEGRAYEAVAATTIDGKVERRKLRVTVLSVAENPDGGWTLTVAQGDLTDPPRFLAARPGPRGDYVSDHAFAMKGEGEAVPELIQRKWADEAYERDKLLREQRLKAAKAAIDGLRQGDRAERRLAERWEHGLNQIIGESEAA